MVNKKIKENIDMVEWIISNKEWIFSGLGIAIISAFFAILKTKLLKVVREILMLVEIKMLSGMETFFKLQILQKKNNNQI